MRQGEFKALGPAGFHRIAYTEWGDRENPNVVICCHGLTRNSRDFDSLAAAICDRHRVLCPDVVGRGASDWLVDKSHYGYPLYVSDMAALIAHTGADSVTWIGTSMGGLIGMMLAAQRNTPISRLLLNDIGQFIPKAALERIVAYTGTDPEFDSLDALERYLRSVHAPFNPLRDEHWQHLARHSARQGERGKLRLAYDPGIVNPMKNQVLEDIDLSPLFAQVVCPVLLLRGEHSDVLPARTAAEMRSGHVKLVELPEVGHAPMFMQEAQIALVNEWLDSGC